MSQSFEKDARENREKHDDYRHGKRGEAPCALESEPKSEPNERGHRTIPCAHVSVCASAIKSEPSVDPIPTLFLSPPASSRPAPPPLPVKPFRAVAARVSGPLTPELAKPRTAPIAAMSDGKDGIDLSALGAAIPVKAELTPEQKVELVESFKKKLQGLGMENTDVLESLAPKVRKRVDALREIQSQHDVLEAKFFEERAALEAKYQKLYEPLYSKRCEIVTGVVEVEGVTQGGDETPAEQKEGKGVPDFWLNAMKNNDILAEEIQEGDEEALKYLKDIKWCRIDDPKGFKIDFFFDTNPFFKNSVLSKTYHMIDEDEPILWKAIGTEIEWHPGKCLTQKVLKKKPRKGSKNTKPITKTENCESFFNFFSPPEVPDDDEEIDEDTAEQLQNQMEQDYDIGSTIRDKIIPHAVSWFIGEAAQDEDYEAILGDDEDDEEDNDDDEEDDEDEDEDDENSGGAAAGLQGERSRVSDPLSASSSELFEVPIFLRFHEWSEASVVLLCAVT